MDRKSPAHDVVYTAAVCRKIFCRLENQRPRQNQFYGILFITDLTCSLAVIAAAAICAGQYREPELTCIVILLGIMFYILEITNLNP